MLSHCSASSLKQLRNITRAQYPLCRCISFVNDNNVSTYKIPGYKSVSKHGSFCNCMFCTTVNKNTEISDILESNRLLQEQVKILQKQLDHESPHSVLTDEEVAREDPEIAQLLANNKQWTIDQAKADPHFFERIGAPQK